MRVLTVTCSCAENYGARLQACALTAWLRSEGHDAAITDYRPAYMRHLENIWPRRVRPLREWLSAARNYIYHRDRMVRHEELERFMASRSPLTRTYGNVRSLRENPPAADALIAGSDQIWNTSLPNGNDPAFFLDFGSEKCRRIAYAASFGTATISRDDAARMQPRLERFDAISVRERSGAAIVAGMGLGEPPVVVDPVFLPEHDYWEKTAENPGVQGDYVVVYDFMRSREVKRVAQRVARLKGSRIIATGPFRRSYAHNRTTASPEQFVGLIRGARCVVSNSFHGSALAMIFGRDFLVVDREDGLNERMHDMLERYGLGCRLASGETPDALLAAPIDYAALRPKLERDIELSKQFLRQALS
ncbi:MAG: polysaccharide pyruvyl transferase family protein [Muribaculaceae bacterium]|nr:polysaccharide pyruvyl transferase family protein [Muribaculaceae bacterium]